MDTMIGRTIDKYRIVQQIEEGGTSTVYKAYQPGLDRYVALKILSPYHTEKPDFSRRFRREARAIARLHHPNILPIYDFGEADGFRFIAMRYIEGSHTLKQEMERPLNLLRAIDLISQVAAALDHAHQHGVIHRDIKPSNILIEGRWALLSDFGLAKTAVDSGKMTRSGLSVGTPAYMSPEQGQGLLMDHRTDIYSLGVIVFELLTGQIPHNAETPFAIVLKRATEPLTMPRSKYPEVTEAVKQAVLKALAPNPDDRFQSAGAFAYALRKALAGAGAVDVHELAKATTPELPAEVEEGASPDHGIARGLPFVRWPRRLLPAALIILVLVMAIGLRLALLPLFDQWMAPISSTELPSTVVATATRPLMEQPPTPAANVASAALVSSADGILYKAQDGEGERLYATNLSGHGPFLLASGVQSASGTFCANSRRVIVEVAAGGRYSYYLMDTDGSNRQLLASDVDEGWAYCSSDGRKVWAAWRRGDIWDAVLVNSDGSHPITLVSGAADYDVSWDRAWHVAATSMREGDQYALYLANIEGDRRREIARGRSTTYSYYPQLSADGRWLMYRTYEGDALFNLYLANAENGQLIELAKGVVYPQGWFSPSSDEILISMMEAVNKPFDLYAVDIGSRSKAHLLSGDEVGGRFAPDERWIAAYARRSGVYHVYVIGADSWQQVEVVEPGDQAEWQDFSPDGRWALVSVRRKGVYHLYRVSADGRQVNEIVGARQAADWYADGTFSVDGRYVMVQLGHAAPDRSSLYLVVSDGGQWVELARNADWQLSGAFTADGEQMVFDSNRDGRRAIYVADADGHNVRWRADGFAPMLGPGHHMAVRHHGVPPSPPPTIELVQAPTPELKPTPMPHPPPLPPATPTCTPPPTPVPLVPPTVIPVAQPTLSLDAAPTATAAPPVRVARLALETTVPSGSSAAGEPVTLGLRNAWGAPGESYLFECSVRAPNGAVTTAQGLLYDDSWAYLAYPDSFPGAQIAEGGQYVFACVVEGQAATDHFFVDEQIRAADTDASPTEP